MLNRVLNDREVCIFGKNAFEVTVAYYCLLMGGVKVSAFVYLEVHEQTAIKIKDFKDYVFKSDKYYLVVADSGNYAEVREFLMQNGYEPIKDFVKFR